MNPTFLSHCLNNVKSMSVLNSLNLWKSLKTRKIWLYLTNICLSETPKSVQLQGKLLKVIS